MNRRLIAVAAVALGVVVMGYALFAGQSDEERILSKLDQLAETVSFSDGAGNPVMRTAYLNGEFEEIFVADVRVSIPELSSMSGGRRDLAGLAAKGSSHFQSLQIDFEQVEVQVMEGTGSARARAVATLTAQRGARPKRDQRRVEFGFTQQDDEWLIDSVTAHTKRDAPP